jgi:hypothetical protein
MVFTITVQWGGNGRVCFGFCINAFAFGIIVEEQDMCLLGCIINCHVKGTIAWTFLDSRDNFAFHIII